MSKIEYYIIVIINTIPIGNINHKIYTYIFIPILCKIMKDAKNER